jgi:hypothetical protein
MADGEPIELEGRCGTVVLVFQGLWEAGMEWLFPAPVTAQQMIRQQRKETNKALREVGTEERTIKREKQEHTNKLRVMIKCKAEPSLIASQAKLIVLCDQRLKQLKQGEVCINQAALELSGLNSAKIVANGLERTTQSMRRMNAEVNPATMRKTARDYQMNRDKIEYTEELVGELMDAENEDNPEESMEQAIQSIINQFSEQDALNTAATMTNVPPRGGVHSDRGDGDGSSQLTPDEVEQMSRAFDAMLTEKIDVLNKP